MSYDIALTVLYASFHWYSLTHIHEAVAQERMGNTESNPVCTME